MSAAGAPAVGGNAGEGGSVEPPPAAGAAGESEGGAGGVAGAESVAGAAGDGAAGSGEVACEAQGSVTALSFDTEPTYSVCRGGIGLLPFSSDGSDGTFTCCGTSNAAYDFTLYGLSDGDGGGLIGFAVPADAPLTEQAVSAECSGGPIATTAGILVTDTAPPVVSSVTEQISSSNGMVQVNGSHLTGVNQAAAVPLDDPAGSLVFCNIDPAAVADDSFTCTFGFLSPGHYRLVVAADSCGAVATLPFQVTKPAL